VNPLVLEAAFVGAVVIVVIFIIFIIEMPIIGNRKLT